MALRLFNQSLEDFAMLQASLQPWVWVTWATGDYKVTMPCILRR